jgi:hypothetical protein
MRQEERISGPICPDTLGKQIVQWNVRDQEAVCNGSIRALAHAGVFGAKVTDIVDGTDVETTERCTDGGHVTCMVCSEDKPGRMQEIEVTVYGWNVLLVLEAAPKIPWAVKVGQMAAPETHWTGALGTQAQATLGGDAYLDQVVLANGIWDGTARWWLHQQGLTCVVPAQATRVVTADSPTQAAAGEEITGGRRVHTVHHM